MIPAFRRSVPGHRSGLDTARLSNPPCDPRSRRPCDVLVKVAVVAHAGKTVGGGLSELRRVLEARGVTDPLWWEVPKSRKAPAEPTTSDRTRRASTARALANRRISE